MSKSVSLHLRPSTVSQGDVWRPLFEDLGHEINKRQSKSSAPYWKFVAGSRLSAWCSRPSNDVIAKLGMIVSRSQNTFKTLTSRSAKPLSRDKLLFLRFRTTQPHAKYSCTFNTRNKYLASQIFKLIFNLSTYINNSRERVDSREWNINYNSKEKNTKYLCLRHSILIRIVIILPTSNNRPSFLAFV